MRRLMPVYHSKCLSGHPSIHLYCLLFIVVTTLFGSGCGVLIGNVRPVDEKDKELDYQNLSKDSQWIRLDLQAERENKDTNPSNTPDTESQAPDVAFQNKSTQAIISVNSACREVARPTDETRTEEDRLKLFTKRLHFGLAVEERKEALSQVDGLSAWDSTVQGKLDGEPIALRTLVVQLDKCIYDVMYMTRPEHFKRHENVFASFVASLKLRRQNRPNTK